MPEMLLPNDEPKSSPLSDLIPTVAGNLVSSKGLIERVIEEFDAEFDDDRVTSATEVEKRTMVRDVAKYVFAVEGLLFPIEEQAKIIQKVYAEVVDFGGLDALFADPTITTIVIDGADKVAIRYAPGSDLVQSDAVFESNQHLRRIMNRLVKRAGAEFLEEIPILELGLDVGERHLCANIVTPPFVTQLRADIRLHSPHVPTLGELRESGYLNDVGEKMLAAIAASPYGFVILGDTESGKTTLLNSMALLLNEAKIVAVERTGDMRLPETVGRYSVQWQTSELAGISLHERVTQALENQPTCLLLDEVRADDPQAIVPLLQDGAPRQCWSFRGSAESKRIRAALRILFQLGFGAETEHALTRFYEQLPFVIMVKRRKGKIQLLEIAEWQPNGDTFDYVPLIDMGWDGCELTGKAAVHVL